MQVKSSAEASCVCTNKSVMAVVVVLCLDISGKQCGTRARDVARGLVHVAVLSHAVYKLSLTASE